MSKSKANPLVTPSRAQIKSFINRCTMLKVEAGDLQMFETMQAIEKVTQVVGFEFASKLKRKGVK